MKPETDPISPDEMLIRLVHRDRFRDRVPVISPSAFEPRVKGNKPDTDGISLFRNDCLAEPADALRALAADKQPLHGIVMVPYAVFTRLGLTVVAAPRADIPGHVVVPELKSEVYAADKSLFNRVKLSLAEAASSNIVRRPTAEPT